MGNQNVGFLTPRLTFCLKASQLLKSLEIPEIEKSLGIPEIEDKDKVIKELEKQIKVAQEATKGNHKTLKVGIFNRFWEWLSFVLRQKFIRRLGKFLV